MNDEWKSQPKEILESWITALKDEAGKSLTKWEYNFVLSVEQHLNRSGTLSQKQQLTLERIYADKMK